MKGGNNFEVFLLIVLTLANLGLLWAVLVLALLMWMEKQL